MLNVDIKILILLVLAPLAVVYGEKYFLNIRKSKQIWQAKENLPFELQRASLFLSESDLHCINPVPLHGRVDQVFELIDKQLVITDTKSRDSHRVYLSDIIQLSAYRPMVEHHFKNHSVKRYGYIRTVLRSPQSRVPVKWHYVELLSDKELTELYIDYWYKRNGVRKRTCRCGGKFH